MCIHRSVHVHVSTYGGLCGFEDSVILDIVIGVYVDDDTGNLLLEGQRIWQLDRLIWCLWRISKFRLVISVFDCPGFICWNSGLLYIYILDRNLVITVPADGLAPDGAGPSVGTVMTTQVSLFCWSSVSYRDL